VNRFSPTPKPNLTMYLYSLTHQRATGIISAINGNFSGGQAQEIIVARSKVLDLLRPDENGKR